MANSKRRHWVIVGAAMTAVVIAAGIATAVSGGDPGSPKAFGSQPASTAGADASAATPPRAPRPARGPTARPPPP
ncbi:hypothetical protein ACFQ9X_12330 [Catenulispora yoronensis]